MDWYNTIKDDIFKQNIKGTYTQGIDSSYGIKIICLGIINIGLSILWFLTALPNKYSIPYNNSNEYNIFLNKGNYLVYVEFDNFYQNNLSYSKSISYDQLKGRTIVDLPTVFGMRGDTPYYPAGNIANTYFLDNIIVNGMSSDNISRKANKDQIGITEYTPNEILRPDAWDNTTNKGTVPLNYENKSSLPILNERFVNWIDLAPFPNFKKLWGRINSDGDNYTFKIESNWYITRKSLYIQEESYLGVRNIAAPIILSIIGFTLIIGGLFIKKLLIN